MEKPLAQVALSPIFFKCYASEITLLLLSMYNDTLKTGLLPDTKPVITFLSKDKDPCDCTN